MKRKIERKKIGKIGVLLVLGLFTAMMLSPSVTADGQPIIDGGNGDLEVISIGTTDDNDVSFIRNNVEFMRLESGVAVFNENAGDIDFRIEGSGDANLFFVDAGNDNVGIGTTGPDAKLDILKSGAGAQLRLTETDGSVYTDFETTADDGYLWINPSGDRVAIGSGPGSATPTCTLYIQTSDAATNTVSYGQRITHLTSGTPAANFGTGIVFELLDASEADVDSAGAIEAIWSTATAGSEASSLLFKTNSAGATDLETKMLIDKDGYVGIGTTNPAAKMHIDQDDAADAFRVDADDESFVINQNGKVGIGTETPDEILDIGPIGIASSTASQSSSEAIALTGSYWTGSEEIKHRFKFRNIASTTADGEGRLGIFADSTEIVTILSGGQVGIGTINPGSMLHVLIDESGADADLISFARTTDSPADDDYYNINFRHENDNNQEVEYAQITLIAEDVSDGTERGFLKFSVADGDDGSMDEAMGIGKGDGAVDKKISFITLRNADGELCYIYPNAAQNNIVVSSTHP